jgi:predicted enzyme related to lactoylglutathione lyase
MPAVMAEQTEYAPGAFSWVDVTTTDLDGAAAFYKGLLGWDHVDRPIGDGAVYRLFQLRGKNVAGGVEQQSEQRSHGIPPHWNNYVTVTSADDTAARVGDLGGNLMMDPFDVFDAGRMAIFTDATGAVLSVWEPRERSGAELFNDPGCLTWNELSTPDMDRAKSFYSDLFGWSFDDVGTDEMPYTMTRNGERMNGGIRPLGEQEKQMGVPPNWMPYFTSADMDQSAAEAGELGGIVMVGPMSVMEGRRIAVVRDPQGVVFGLFEGETDI